MTSEGVETFFFLVLREFLRGLHAVGLVKVEGVGEVLEDLDGLGPLALGRLDLETVHLDALGEGQAEDELLVAVRLEEAAARGHGVTPGVVVRLVQALAARLVEELAEVDLGNNRGLL